MLVEVNISAELIVGSHCEAVVFHKKQT